MVENHTIVSDRSKMSLRLIPGERECDDCLHACRSKHGVETMPYEQLANAFRDGDVLYGLQNPRDQALSIMIRTGYSRRVTVPKYFLGCIPEGNVNKKNIMIQNDLTDAMWTFDDRRKYFSNGDRTEELADDKRFKQFKEFVSKHGKYNVAKQFKSAELGDGDNRKAWTRLSKAGLEYQVRRNRTVHFILTGINFDQVSKKEGFGKKGNVTSAELRWLYRHRNTQEVVQNVRFWLPETEVEQKVVWERLKDYNTSLSTIPAEFGSENAIRAFLDSRKV